METEIEAKFLNIDTEKIREKLKEIGAVLNYSERLMKRKTFDFKDKSLYEEKAWVRVRDEGDGKITLSYKKLVDSWQEITFIPVPAWLEIKRK